MQRMVLLLIGYHKKPTDLSHKIILGEIIFSVLAEYKVKLGTSIALTMKYILFHKYLLIFRKIQVLCEG